MNEIFLAAFWVSYYVLHSTLASSAIKDFFRKIFPVVYPHYRALYSMIAVVNFVLLFGLHVRVSSTLLIQPNLTMTALALILAACGLTIALLALRSYQLSFLWSNEEQPSTPQSLITTGMNAYVRHPMYFGILLIVIAFVFYAPKTKNAIFAVISIAYIFIGARLEERKLYKQYGKQYAEYAAQVRMFIPYVF